jgi:hypothetical protein
MREKPFLFSAIVSILVAFALWRVNQAFFILFALIALVLFVLHFAVGTKRPKE